MRFKCPQELIDVGNKSVLGFGLIRMYLMGGLIKQMMSLNTDVRR
jgi:hypothetical protein